MRNRYIVYVTRGEDGTVDRVTIPMRYVYVFVAAALTGMFTIAGMAGSYSRMLAKAETINRLRDELAMTRKDYAHLEKTSHEKDVQVASLGSLASEVSAIYGFTAGKLTHPKTAKTGKLAVADKPSAADAAKAPLVDEASSFTDDSYYKSLDTFYALRATADEGEAARNIDQGIDQSFGLRTSISGFDSANGDLIGSNTPDMWPVLGPINSGFGEREDPILGTGESEFHKGVDIGSPNGTPVHAPANGRVLKVGLGNGYGREIEIDHGNGIHTLYAHLQGFNVVAGQNVVKGEVIGYVGHSGSRVTGPNLHYEVQIRGNAVNPHTYLKTTMAQLGGGMSPGL